MFVCCNYTLSNNNKKKEKKGKRVEAEEEKDLDIIIDSRRLSRWLVVDPSSTIESK